MVILIAVLNPKDTFSEKDNWLWELNLDFPLRLLWCSGDILIQSGIYKCFDVDLPTD